MMKLKAHTLTILSIFLLLHPQVMILWHPNSLSSVSKNVLKSSYTICNLPCAWKWCSVNRPTNHNQVLQILRFRLITNHNHPNFTSYILWTEFKKKKKIHSKYLLHNYYILLVINPYDPQENSRKDHQALSFPPSSIELISTALKTLNKI